MEPAGSAASGGRHAHGQVFTEVIDDRILVMTVDRVEKKNAFTPKISGELASAYTRLDEDRALLADVLTFAGDHATAGLEMPLYFGPDAEARQPAGSVDPYRLRDHWHFAVAPRGARPHAGRRRLRQCGRKLIYFDLKKSEG